MTLARPVTLFLLAIALVLHSSGEPQTQRQQTGSDTQNAPRVEIANVLFRYSPEVSIYLNRMRGVLMPTAGHRIPTFNDPESFVMAVDAGEARMSSPQLSGLMNSWLLSSPNAQIKNVKITTAGSQLEIQGTMKKGLPVPFRAVADLSVTSDNRIRIAVRQVKTAHLPVKGIMDAFGVSMQSLISQKGLKGMSVDGDSFLIDPQTAFPAPQIRARLSNVHLSGDSMVIVFGQGAPSFAHPPARNYIALRGGTIGYGREQMSDADLVMIDSTPADPFEFYLHRYWCQMVAGDIKVTPEQGLRIRVTDFSKLPRNACR